MTGSRRASTVANYFGQLRIYSYVDLILLWLALDASAMHIVAGSLLWFGFLIHLEWRHRDRGRERWPIWAWLIPWIAVAALEASLAVAVFLVLAVLYAFKKQLPRVAVISFLYNGGLKLALAYVIAAPLGATAITIFVLMSIRNLCGDLRDTVKDRSEGVRTLPVELGLPRGHPLVYPVALAATSTFWTWLGGLPVLLLLAAFLIQAATYRLTPR